VALAHSTSITAMFSTRWVRASVAIWPKECSSRVTSASIGSPGAW